MQNVKRLGMDWPRRSCSDLWIPAEKAIQDTVNLVEDLGAHTLLTDAVILLGQARDKISDWAEETGNVKPEAA
jgi:hypothetical protein